MGDFFFKRTQAQGTVEAARNSQLAGRSGPHGQADQAGIATTGARLGNRGFEPQTSTQVFQVEGVGNGGGDGRRFGSTDAGAAHGLFEGLALANLDGNGFRRSQAGRRSGSGKGLGLQRSNLGLGQGRDFFSLRRLVNTSGE